MSTYDRFAQPRGLSRNALIAIGVVLLHVGALWALQTGLLRRAVEIIVPATLLTEYVSPPAPVTQAAPPPPAPAPKPQRPTQVKAPAPRPAPEPLPIADTTPSPNALTVSPAKADPEPPAPITAAGPATPTAAPPAPAAPKIELPSSNAAYLQNPAPAYPAISKRMGEQGKVVLRVFINTDGLPQKIEINQSSGFDRLDRQAQDTVLRWKFVPGKRNGVPEAMWYLVPINFVLE
ncbi:MAG TPA: energy transducer TonB [Comamonadaceae bacterium]|nr:MAG: energy transducer TonB [Burkholderiales bacterium RIFCSPLOWO2_12_FULL_65_40]HCE28260.1 energy transducer TonB [Comamonadaceae bacterium]